MGVGAKWDCLTFLPRGGESPCSVPYLCMQPSHLRNCLGEVRPGGAGVQLAGSPLPLPFYFLSLNFPELLISPNISDQDQRAELCSFPIQTYDPGI